MPTVLPPCRFKARWWAAQHKQVRACRQISIALCEKIHNDCQSHGPLTLRIKTNTKFSGRIRKLQLQRLNSPGYDFPF